MVLYVVYLFREQTASIFLNSGRQTVVFVVGTEVSFINSRNVSVKGLIYILWIAIIAVSHFY